MLSIRPSPAYIPGTYKRICMHTCMKIIDIGKNIAFIRHLFLFIYPLIAFICTYIHSSTAHVKYFNNCVNNNGNYILYCEFVNNYTIILCEKIWCVKGRRSRQKIIIQSCGLF